MPILTPPTDTVIATMVQRALEEDIGSGDISAALLDANAQARASIISRQAAVLCGCAWVDAVYQQLDSEIRIDWQVQDGAVLHPDQLLCTVQGNARSLLTGERCALNFLQTLSATATVTATYVHVLAGYTTQLLDTRKTLPGWRHAQKYAVRCGGGHNHRMGLYDAFLIKENHIAACGSISRAVATARHLFQDKRIEVEVETLPQLQEALDNRVEFILLDNFILADIYQAVQITRGRARLEVSGGVDLNNIKMIAATGVDFISVGALTKHIQAIDLSLRVCC